MLSQAWRTRAATASSPPASPRNAVAKSITGMVRVASATSFTAIVLKMFMRPPGACTIPPSPIAAGGPQLLDVQGEDAKPGGGRAGGRGGEHDRRRRENEHEERQRHGPGIASAPQL